MEDLDIRACITCGKQQVPIIVLIKKDGSVVFCDKKETILLELSRENFEYLYKLKQAHLDTPEEKTETIVQSSEVVLPEKIKFVTDRPLTEYDIEILATVPNKYDLNTEEQKQMTVSEKSGFIVVRYRLYQVVEQAAILKDVYTTLESLKTALIVNKNTNILSQIDFVKYMEYPEDTKDFVEIQSDYEHYLLNPEKYVSGSTFVVTYKDRIRENQTSEE